MSAEPVFIDTNVLVYAYDSDANRKHVIANTLLQELWQSRTGVVSVQVLQEFYVTVTGKLPRPLTKKAARAVLQTYEAWPVYSPTAHDVVAAAELGARHSLSFWEAMIIIAAQMSGSVTLLTEDIQHERRFGATTITNPFHQA